MSENLEPRNIYSYFRDCYRLDYKEFTVENILSLKYKYKWFAKDTEILFSERDPYIPYPNKKLSELEKEMELFKLEKKLFYGTFFLLGKSEGALSNDKRICAPLILFPAEIVHENELEFLSIDCSEPIINRSVLSKLELQDAKLSKDGFEKELLEIVEEASRNEFKLKTLVDKYFCNVQTDELLLYPKVWTESKLRAHFSSFEHSPSEYLMVPAAGTVLVEKSESSLKVLNDLEALSGQNSFNVCLSELFTNSFKTKSAGVSYFTSKLNSEQQSALFNATKFSNSVLIGPPGTGKSYTIACIVADAVVNGKSVLVVSKTKQAVEVVRGMLETIYKLKDYIVHTSGTNYKTSLKAKIQRYLSGIQKKASSRGSADMVHKLHSRIEKFQSNYQKNIDKELKYSSLHFGTELSLLKKVNKFVLSLRNNQGEKNLELFSELFTLYETFEKELNAFAKNAIAVNISTNANKYRKDISLYFDSIDSTSFTAFQEGSASVNYSNVLKVFPIWLANLSDLNSVLPLHKEIFDLVIIDEATQCDIASALPAIYRGKHTIIAGDPNQLKHYSFVSSAQQQEHQKKYNLPQSKIFDYRNRSILDLFISKVSSQEQVTFLREHFRSSPSLIQFSNKEFYEGQLQVMKSLPENTRSQIKLLKVNGERNNQGINEEEVLAVVEKVEEIVQQHSNKETAVPSVGIISPFSSQAKHINKLIRNKFSLEVIKKFDLLCGSPYTFQGSEREIILLSLCVSNSTHHSAYLHANKPEVLNVAITRAKSLQYVFLSASEEKLGDSLLGKYISFISTNNENLEAEQEADAFQEDVIAALKKKGINEIYQAHPVAGSVLDLLVCHNGKHFFIDLIGYPGQYVDAFSMERYQTFGRTGIRCLPLHYSFWENEKEKALKMLAGFIL